METAELTQQNFIEFLSNPQERKRLLTALREETGSHLPLINHCWKLAETCKATSEQLRNIAHELMKLKGKRGDYDSLLCLFVRHPTMPEDVLLELLEQNLCICDLGHLGRPLWLLERLAEEEEFSEAITSLALYYYSNENYRTAKFIEFIKKHKDDDMLKYNITRCHHLPPKKWQAVLEVFGEANR